MLVRIYIVGVTSLIRDVLRKCLICRKVQGKPSDQLMADLPSDRLWTDDPPFASTGTDYFGPFYVTRGRSKLVEKR